jgi:hypothetical protein
MLRKYMAGRSIIMRMGYLGQVALRLWLGQESRGVDNDVYKVDRRVPVNGMVSQSSGTRLQRIHPKGGNK